MMSQKKCKLFQSPEMILLENWNVDHEEIIGPEVVLFDGSSTSDPILREQGVIDSVESVCTEPNTITPSPNDTTIQTISTHAMATTVYTTHAQKTDSLLATILSDNFFLSEINNNATNSVFKMVCDVCCKKFVRADVLKRHLIGHIVKSSLAQNPVSSDGTLSILCGICKAATFSRVDAYKTHLSEHAKLTIHRCEFCGKCCNDASNFTKHMKIHDSLCFQCNLCKRKFKSRGKMTDHIALHDATPPLICQHCGKIFYFNSMLNKHINRYHYKELNTKFRCTFCNEYVNTVKEKLDHEWSVHSIRKTVIDCIICGKKFRKYSDMKKHCFEKHIVVIPPKKEFMKNAVKR